MWQKLVDSYEETVECSGERKTPKEIKQSCNFSYEQEWIFLSDVVTKMPKLDNAAMEKDALIKTYEYYLKKYNIK